MVSHHQVNPRTYHNNSPVWTLEHLACFSPSCLNLLGSSFWLYISCFGICGNWELLLVVWVTCAPCWLLSRLLLYLILYLCLAYIPFPCTVCITKTSICTLMCSLFGITSLPTLLLPWFGPFKDLAVCGKGLEFGLLNTVIVTLLSTIWEAFTWDLTDLYISHVVFPDNLRVFSQVHRIFLQDQGGIFVLNLLNLSYYILRASTSLNHKF